MIFGIEVELNGAVELVEVTAPTPEAALELVLVELLDMITSGPVVVYQQDTAACRLCGQVVPVDDDGRLEEHTRSYVVPRGHPAWRPPERCLGSGTSHQPDSEEAEDVFARIRRNQGGVN